MRETGSNSLEKKQKREFVRAEIDDQYSMTKICPKCGTTMVYACLLYTSDAADE